MKFKKKLFILPSILIVSSTITAVAIALPANQFIIDNQPQRDFENRVAKLLENNQVTAKAAAENTFPSTLNDGNLQDFFNLPANEADLSFDLKFNPNFDRGTLVNDSTGFVSVTLEAKKQDLISVLRTYNFSNFLTFAKAQNASQAFIDSISLESVTLVTAEEAATNPNKEDPATTFPEAITSNDLEKFINISSQTPAFGVVTLEKISSSNVAGSLTFEVIITFSYVDNNDAIDFVLRKQLEFTSGFRTLN